jgi:diaminopimelate epimerase
VPTLSLTKYQALGNDYLVLDLPLSSPADLSAVLAAVPRLCDRHLGLGADGLLVFDPDRLAIRILNPDGSEAEKSGNGLRISACHAVLEHGAPAELTLLAGGLGHAVRVLGVDGPEVVSEVDIGVPELPVAGWVELATPAGTARCRLVELGNPHCVVFGEPVTEERCRELGPHLERHPRFPNRTNVQLAEPVGRERVRAEIWERGAGYTMASGTSAAAVAAACMDLDVTDAGVQVAMPGGTLDVRRAAGGHLVQTGPARRVYRATAALDDLGG